MSISSIPMDIVRNILDYDNRFVIRGTEIIQINKIDKNDERYAILSSIPKIKHCNNEFWIDYWLDLPIANTKRKYLLVYIPNYQPGISLFTGSLVDWDLDPEDSEPDEANEEVFYWFAIPKNNV